MRLPATLTLAGVATLLVAACSGGSAPTPAPSSSTADGGGSSAWLRATTTQAIPPANLFAVGPTAVITADGTYVLNGPVRLVYPGPLLPNLQGSHVSDAGRAAIVAEAERLGLIGTKTDFRSPATMPGGVLGHLDLTIDGRVVSLLGDPSSQIMCIMAPCEPPPGTPEAFGELWRKLADPGPWLGSELEPGGPFVASSYALLVGPAPAPDPALGAQIADWPLDIPLATFGGPVANGTLRCGIVDGADAETLRPALEEANELTQWVQDPSTSATFGLTVRPIIAGEDPCRDTFGG